MEKYLLMIRIGATIEINSSPTHGKSREAVFGDQTKSHCTASWWEKFEFGAACILLIDEFETQAIKIVDIDSTEVQIKLISVSHFIFIWLATWMSHHK